MKNQTSNERTVIGLFALLILISGKLSAQSEILGHIYLGTFEGHTYYRSECLTAWYEANEAATEMGGYLATITSEAEDCFLAPYTPSYEPQNFYGGAWIGLWAYEQNDSCDYWQWLNEEPMGYENWANPNAYVNNGPIFCGQPVLIGRDSDFFGHNPCYFYYGWIRYPDVWDGLSWYIVEFDSDPGCSNADKSYVCHNGNTICVNNDAVQAHLNHGDYAGPCGPCNTYAMQTIPDESIETEGHPLQTAKVMLSEPKEEQNVAQEISSYKQIHIFPNPASQEVYIELPGVTQEGTIRILSLTGQEMHTHPLRGQQSIIVDLSAYTAGIYLIDVRSASVQYQKRIVKL